MYTNLTRVVSIGLLLVAGSLSASAQEQIPSPAEPSSGTFRVLGAQSNFGKVVRNAPYSATAITEIVQTLSDGNQITRSNQAKLYRDSQGRTRVEQTLGTIGNWTANGEPAQLIGVNDPVALVSFTLNPRNRTAYKSVTGINTRDAGDIADYMRLKQAAIAKGIEQKKEILAKQGKTLPALSAEEIKQMKMKGAPSGDFKLTDGNKKGESLGKQVIEGIEVEGQRVTTSIPAGQVGNRLPIEITTETWYSPELQMIVLSKHHDPRSGDTTYRLTSISRSEPDRLLFEIPADYAVQENSVIHKAKPVKEDQ
jgi:hypothetical protein